MPQHNLKIIDKYQVAENTLVYRFEKPQGFGYLPGQSVLLQLDFPADHKEEALRDMTLASSPTDEYLEITMRQSTSKFKNALGTMSWGKTVKAFGPKGKFVLDEDETKQHIMIAGGIGIAPFISMLKYIKDKNLSHKVILLYSNPTPERTSFRDEITEIKKIQKSKNHQLDIIYTLTGKTPEDWSGETSRINGEMIKKYVSDLDNSIFYICGSTPMVLEVKAELLSLGIDEPQIREEEFTGY